MPLLYHSKSTLPCTWQYTASVNLADRGLESCVHFLFWLQCVPLGHWTPRIGQHVWPMAKSNPWCTVANPALANWVIASQLVVVVHSDQHLNFLCMKTIKRHSEEIKSLLWVLLHIWWKPGTLTMCHIRPSLCLFCFPLPWVFFLPHFPGAGLRCRQLQIITRLELIILIRPQLTLMSSHSLADCCSYHCGS